MPRSLDGLAAQWREEAETLRKRGAAAQAVAVESCADELTRELANLETEELTLTQAARVCGYSADHLGRLIRDGKIANAGRNNAPRVRRADLPRKATLRAVDTLTHIPHTSREQIARSIVQGGKAR